MIKIEINDPEGLKSDLMLVRSVLRDGGLPLELRYPISFLISKIQEAQNELLEGRMSFGDTIDIQREIDYFDRESLEGETNEV